MPTKTKKQPSLAPGDVIYVMHPQRGPMSASVIGIGQHGVTVASDDGDLHRVRWHNVIGVQAHAPQHYRISGSTAGGTFMLDKNNKRHLLLHKSRPSIAQIQAGNYKKKHIRFHGLNISIENEKGSVRRGKNADGSTWEIRMQHDYGYIRQTQGTDKDHVDCYIGPNRNAKNAYIIHQQKYGQWNRFDEDKVMLGFDSDDHAKDAYLKHYDDPRFFGGMTTMPMPEFCKKVLRTFHHPSIIKAHEKILFMKATIQVKGYTTKRGTFVSAYTATRQKGQNTKEHNSRQMQMDFSETDHKTDHIETVFDPLNATKDEYLSHKKDTDFFVRHALETADTGMQSAKNDEEKEFFRQIYAKTADEVYEEHLYKIRRALLTNKKEINQKVLQSYGILNQNDLNILLKPQHNNELSTAAVIERGRQAANKIFPKFINKYTDALKNGDQEQCIKICASLLSKMKNRTAELMKLRGTTIKEFVEQQAIRYLDQHGNPVDAAQHKTYKGYVQKFFETFGPVASILFLQEIKQDKARSYNNGGAIFISSSTTHPIGRDIFHEMAHSADGLLGEQCWRFVLSRKTTAGVHRLNDIYNTNEFRDNEVAIKGNFIVPYIGKSYHPVGVDPETHRPDHTEVFSVGAERFSDPKALHGLLQTDIDYAMFIIGIIPHLNPPVPTEAERENSRAEILPLA